MRKNLNSSLSLGEFPSPGIGSFREKGWWSERVQNPSGTSRRHSSNPLTPFYSGRTLPSKWEDAERWISSPVLGYGVPKYYSSHWQNHLACSKSKSGPLVPPGIAYYTNCSPPLKDLDAGVVRNFIANSPFSTGVFKPKGLGGQAIVASSVNGLGWSDLATDCSSPSSQENTVTRVISRRDMATQMSPDASTSSSPPPSISPAEQSDHKMEIREVQVDKRATQVSRNSRNDSYKTKKGLSGVQDVNRIASESHLSSWDLVLEASSEFSKFQREEAKITAWETLQEAKAEAAIRKLEMKLEKKKSSSMDKISSKLRMAHIKAQEMRNSISTTQEDSDQIPMDKISHKASFFRKHARLSLFNNCFTCYRDL